ncbi:alpha-amylase family glycosyl hydrolase [soil metagenome]
MRLSANFCRCSESRRFKNILERRPELTTDKWWQTGIIYQIYPRSFADSEGDGTGDIRGVISKLDYLESLGIDAIWLSPIYPSPMADFGYDVSNYTDVHPMFGSLEDFDELVEEAHRRDLKVILDFVPNHSSDEHPWFEESRSSKDSPKRDWYIWADPAPDGGPPNNWVSHFVGEAWTLDETTGQYYLHSFDPKQPDLNWRNPEVREAMYGAMSFWYERGVDGFRIDVLWIVIKDQELRDNPASPDWKPGDPPWERQSRTFSEDQFEVHEIAREMRKLADSYGERVLIGEIYLPLERLMTYYGEDLDGVHLPFNFQLILLEDWNAQSVRNLVDEYEAALPEGGWPNWVLSNHDNPRVASRIGAERARLAQMLLLTLRGTPTVYYGDEIGMHDVDVPAHRVVDPRGKDDPELSRDPARTPMQWDDTPSAGFTEGEPWLPVAEDADEVNVAAQQEDSGSMLAFFRRLTEVRRELTALHKGSYQSVDTGNSAVFAYLREHEGQRVLEALNFDGETQQLELPPRNEGKLLCSTNPDRAGEIDPTQMVLQPYEGVMVLLEDEGR